MGKTSKIVSVVDGVTYKRCSYCYEYKKEDMFHNSKTGVLGKQSICKDCVKIRDRKYYSTKRGKEVTKKRNQKFYHEKGGKEYQRKYRSNGRGAAYARVAYAIAIGRIPHTDIPFERQECVNKGKGVCSPGKTQFHHTEGYDKPYTGIWVCPHCHKVKEQEKKNAISN